MDEQNLPVETPPKKPNYLLWILSGVVSLIFLVLIAAVVIAANLVISSAKNLPAGRPVLPQVETPAPVTPTPKIVSKFATDSAVLSLSKDLSKLRADIDSVDLFESQLVPPSIDLQIRIQTAN